MISGVSLLVRSAQKMKPLKEGSKPMEKGKTVLIETNKLVVTNQPMEPAGTEDVERLKQSISTIGLLYPLLIRALPDTGTFEVLDGRTRLGALTDLGYTMVECSLAEPIQNAGVIPYDTELCRRHLSADQRRNYEIERNAVVASSISTLVDRLIPELRNRALNMLEKPDVTKEETDLISSWAYLSERQQETALEHISSAAVEAAAQEYEEELNDLKKDKESIEGELEKAKAQIKAKEKEFEQRLKDFAEEARGRIQDLRESKKLIIPEDPEEKDKLIKKIEKELAKQYADEVKHAKANLEKANENFLKLQAEMDKKKDDIESLNRQLKDVKAENGSYEETISILKETLDKATNIDKTVRKLDGVCDDLRTLNELIIERKFTLKEIGVPMKNQIKKVLADIQDALSGTMDIVKDIA